MRCLAVQERLGAYLDGQLDPPAAREVAAHLDACAACMRELNETRELVARLRPAAEAPVPAELWDAIAARLDAAGSASPGEVGRGFEAARAGAAAGRRIAPARLVRRYWRTLASAAVLAVAVGAGWLTLGRPGDASASAGRIDFRPLLERASGDIEAGVRALLRAHGGEAISPAEAARRVPLRVHLPDPLPAGLELAGAYVLHLGGEHRALGFHLKGPRGQLLILQCPPTTRKEFGGEECLPCHVGARAGQVVRAGPLRLMHFEGRHACICVVATLSEEQDLPAALGAIRFDE